MNFRYYNANPLGRQVNDCTVRAISLAEDRSWDETHERLSAFARNEGIMPDEVEYIDKYLNDRYEKICGCRSKFKRVGEFARANPEGTYLITMSGHITCCKDGIIYDTFDPSRRYIWDVYKV